MKKSPVLAALAVTALGLSACSGQTGTGSSQAADGTTAMTWGMWIASTDDQAAWQQVADTVTQDHPEITLTIQGAPWGDYWTKLSTQIGTAEAPCIISIQSLRAAQFVEGLVPLDELIADSDLDLSEFDEGALSNLNINGSQYGLPYDNGPVIIFYNADLFAEAGVEPPVPGWTTDDFEAAAQALADAGVSPLGQTVEDIFVEGMTYGYNGTLPIADDGTVQTNDPGFVEAIDWLGGLTSDGLASPADGADSSGDDNAFINGSVAMHVNGPWSLIDFSGKVSFEMGIATVPAGDAGGNTVSAGSGFGISSTCQTPEAAFTAITSMTGEPVLTGLAEQGRAFPARTAAQPAWMDKASDVAQISEAMQAAQSHSDPAPGSPDAEQMQQLYSQYLPEAVNGTKPAAEVLDNIQAQIG
ncbi:MAG: ABC transporter substrate-binding protein [Arachnia sp.]